MLSLAIENLGFDQVAEMNLNVTNKQLSLTSKTHQTSRIMNSIVAKEIFISELLVTIFNNTKFRLYHTDKDIAKFCLFVRLMGR